MSVETLLFKNLLTDVYKLIKNKASLLKKLKNLNAENAFLSASNVEKVKTIWQVDKEVCLHEFFYPTSIINEYKKIPVTGLDTFPENGKIVIQGTAGQGKSVLLRYIAGTELRKGNVLPIFIELRKISDRKSLTDLVLDNLSELGLDIDNLELNALLSTGKCVLILDAFDEVPESEVQSVISTMESWSNQHHNLCIVVSSRANAEIQKSAYFRVYNISELEVSDFEPLLNKLFSNSNGKVQEILKAIHSSDNEIIEVLKTPLLLTLLVIVYKSHNDIPNNLAEFYESLFHILCFRHDSTKPGFKREFSTQLPESKLSKLFDAFCFTCMKGKLSSLTREEALDFTSEAFTLCQITDIENEFFLKDITKVTCLLVEEGFRYHFIHKSIREFHAACYIKNSTEALKIKFYSHAINNTASYRQELSFLCYLDEYMYKKYFLIPHIQNKLTRLQFNTQTQESNITAKEVLSGYTAIGDYDKEKNIHIFQGISYADSSYVANDFHNLHDKFVNFSFRISKKMRKEYRENIRNIKRSDPNFEYSTERPLSECIEMIGETTTLELELNKWLKTIYIELKTSEEYVFTFENTINSIAF